MRSTTRLTKADDASEQANSDLLGLTAGVVAAYVQNNATSVSGLPDLIASVNAALAGLLQPAAPTASVLTPASSPKRSVTSDFIVCLEDGTKFKSLKRHLATHFGTTPAEYRTKWGCQPTNGRTKLHCTAFRACKVHRPRPHASRKEKVPTKRKAKA